MEQLVQMKREEGCWQVDRQNYPLLLDYLRLYFIEDAFSRITVPHAILYAEMEDEDFLMLSPLFGAVYADSERLVVKELHPLHYVVPWRDALTLRLCVAVSNDRRLFLQYFKKRSNL